MTPFLNTTGHPIEDTSYVATCHDHLEATGALVLRQFFTTDAIERVVKASSTCESEAFYANSTHNVYLTPVDSSLPANHTFNLQVESSKGLIADDQVPADSPLRSVYHDADFRSFLCGVLGIDEIYSYADELSSINVHFASEGRELGWHFDNSSFAVTMLLQAPEAGGVFEYVPHARDSASGDQGFDVVGDVLAGESDVLSLEFAPGDLVLFRGRDALHRVTPTVGDTTRLLTVFAFNDEPGLALSDSALMTFYGRTA